MNKPEQVFFYDWYDGPRTGVANYNNMPHFFESQWKDLSSQEEDIYKVSPIGEGLTELAKEAWEIWKRWDIAYHKGHVDKDTHPYLPEDKVRGEKIKEKLDLELKVNKSNCLNLKASFEIADDQEDIPGMKKLLVTWVE